MRAGILFLLLASTTFSTVPATPQGPAVDGAVHTQIEGIAIPTIANAPFTAKIVVAWDEPLSGGGTLSRTYYTMVARDNKGRVRREARGFLPTGSTEKPPLRSFQINDPTSNKQITCRAATKRCAVTDYHPRAALNQPASGPDVLSRKNLGEQNVNSMRVVGTRETMAMATGPRSSDRVLLSSRELWYSPDLQMDMSVVRKDPQMGQVTLTVTELIQGKPDAKWFTVPDGYQIIDAGNGAGIPAARVGH